MDKLYWLGEDSKPSYDDYSRISTCLALSQSVYAPDKQACVNTLNELKDSMQHGISQVLFSVNCTRQYIIALKERTKEIYIAFRGTESWKALLISFRVYAQPNDSQGTVHSGYYQQAKLIPLAPFFYLLNKYKDYKLIFTGHSLGGAIASIVTLNMLGDLRSINFRKRIFCVAFGSPFIGNEACSKYVDERYQKNFQFYVNCNDIIPYLLTFIYNQSFELLSKSVSEKCSEWLQTLALSLVAGGSPAGVFSRWTRRLGIKRSSTQAECENEFLGLSKYIIETCRDALQQVLPVYHPFGLYFRTKCTNISAGIATTFTIERLSLKDVFRKDIHLDKKDIVCSIQDHFIKNYVNEIYVNVIAKKEIVPRTDCPSVSLIECSSNFSSSSSPLSIFLPSEKTSWIWKDPSVEYENENPSYMWSIVANKYEDKEEITLRIYGSAVSLITGLKCENSIYAETALAPEGNYDESVRLFILYFPVKENRHANNYSFYIISHFNTVNLTGLFDPKKFSLSNGMRGRKQQIADLTVLELYKLAYAYCTFTDDQMIGDTGVDVTRRKTVKQHLLLSEKTLDNDCRMLEEDYLNRLKGEQLRELMKGISYASNDSNGLEKSPPSSPCQSDDEDDRGNGGLGRPLSSKDKEKDSISTKIDFLSIESAMSNWRGSMSASRLYQSQISKISNSSNNVLSTTESVVQVIPRLFTMNIALTKDFALKFDVRDISWKQIGVATIAGCLVGLWGGVVFLSDMVTLLVATGGSGIIAGGIQAIYQCLTTVHSEYMKILVLVAKSLGVIMDQVRMHQYCLEEKISSIYHDRLKELPSKEHVFDEWKNIFPGGVLNKLQDPEKQYHCISIMKCIDANFQMRKLLSKDFALGVIGPGKSGKSTLLQNMFGFDTNPDKEIRTEDLRSYRVNDDFRVVDFPHMTSAFDYVKNCFTCNHNLVNAIIVVLNAEQGGNDIEGEGYVVKEVKKLAKKGVNVLFCFNQCDKLALKKRSNEVRQNIDKFSLYKAGQIQQSNASIENDQYEYWTEEHAENKRRQWAKNYHIDLDDCWMTFSELDEINEIKCQENYKRLESIKLRSYLDIKEIWLRKVLEENYLSEENCLSEESINEIMNFRYEGDQ